MRYLIIYIDLKMELSPNDAYGAINTDSTWKANESEICTPTVEGQHVYEHINNTVTVKEIALETHSNQVYESVIIGKE